MKQKRMKRSWKCIWLSLMLCIEDKNEKCLVHYLLTVSNFASRVLSNVPQYVINFSLLKTFQHLQRRSQCSYCPHFTSFQMGIQMKNCVFSFRYLASRCSWVLKDQLGRRAFNFLQVYVTLDCIDFTFLPR